MQKDDVPVETPQGPSPTPPDLEFKAQMEAAEEILRAYCNAFSALAR